MNEAYAEKLIIDLNSEDKKVAISGYVISKEENNIVIDDGSAKIPVFFDQVEVPDSKYVRVFGRVIIYQEGTQVQADLIQDLSTINFDAYKKTINLMKEKAVN